MTASALSSRRFTLEDQLEFAEISGDWNPMHVDPIAARRTIYGDVVVHGIHSLLWALECVAQIAGEKRGLSHLKTEFKRQMDLDDVISCKLLRLDNRDFKLCLEAKGKVLVRVEGSFSQSRRELPDLPKKISGRDCRDLNFEEVTAASGSLPLFVDEDRFGKIFPGVSRLLPNWQIAELMATTRLVGMECPGLHSIYSGHNLHFHDEHTDGRELHYEVVRSDSRFSILWLNVKAPAMSGTITAFVRPRPRTQAAVDVVRGAVTQDEFAKSRALVIGGSRGLGEITAKIIAAGGGDVWITYHRGREDAERVTREIRSAGFKCSYLRFDATASEELIGQFESTWKPNQLYYFATPPISLETGDWFSPEKFHTYCRFYVNGFSSTVKAVLRLGAETLSVFYPSTIFLEEFQEHSNEYCAAKAAGELLCRQLERLFPHVNVYAPRLGRMKTDQTSGLMPIDAEDPLFGMVNAIREMSIRLSL
jgi:acyl dehydratase/NAD(P)-dependent dehydrogenase (short-subunit alcohol dehydrogenase family)